MPQSALHSLKIEDREPKKTELKESKYLFLKFSRKMDKD